MVRDKLIGDLLLDDWFEPNLPGTHLFLSDFRTFPTFGLLKLSIYHIKTLILLYKPIIMLRISLITILICGIISSGYAQDSTKKLKPVKPAVINKAYKYHTSKYYVPKKDTTATTRALQRTAPLRHDSVAVPTAPLDKSLNGQYQFLLSKIYHYQQPMVSALWKSAMDTININKRKLKSAESRLSTQDKAIDSLKADAATKDQTLASSNAKINGMTILGITLSKTSYNFIVWGLVLIFGVTAIVVIARTGNYGREAKYRTQLYNELEEEFKAYKAKANDKEKKLARELQTERNKVDELMGRG